MKIINRYILEELRGPLILSVFVFTFIFLLDIMVAMMENIIVKGISIVDILRLLSFYIPPILTQTIPIGLFLGIMICFSKFSRNSESVAMVSTGMSINDILKPILVVAFSLSLFILFLQESIIPRSFVKLKYLGAKIAYENPIFQLKEKTFIDTMEEYSIYVDQVESDGRATDVLIFEKNEKNEFSTVLVGKEAFWKDYSIVINDAQFINFTDEGKKNVIGTFDEKKVSLTPFFEDFNLKIKDVESLSVSTLISEMKDKKIEEKISYKVEIYRKLALIFSTVPLSILGLVLSIGHHRTSRKYAFSLAMIIVFSYIVLLNMGIVMANASKMNPLLATWLPNILLSAVTYKFYRLKQVRGI
ncbi:MULTISPECIES: LptF/LptG family permease [Fusobacterium]|uniref:LptF/LptG family permease n=1 Tax=Fusobacterium TaxID=848 RepID=UPI0025C2C588|nr:LptF/LptG family permease [Fusobacterium sp.]MCI5724652.1 LptF/LptG family permease [Fusobacterium sp.]MDY5305871.1 LptF/LptG family permease [Fusobacterium gastrosuis]